MCIWDVLNVNASRTKLSLRSTENCPNRDFLLEQLKNCLGVRNLTHKLSRRHTIWKDVPKKCVGILCELANKKDSSCTKSQFLCLNDRNSKKEELEAVGELSKVCSQIVLECLYLPRIGGPDILWSVNKLARAGMARLSSYIPQTDDYRHFCHVGNTTQQCRLGLFQDSDFAGDLEDSKSTWREFCVCSKVEHCSHKLEVQEVNISVSQFHRI